MNTKKVLSACALTAVLLSGCSSNQAAQGTSNQTTANPPTSAAATADQSKDQTKQPSGAPAAAMNPNQRTMVSTFQSLIMMDKSNGLAITKDQAGKMLPLVQDSITKGELSTDAQTNLIAQLTAEQKKFIDDKAAAMQQRANGQGGQRRQGNQSGANSDGQDQGNQGGQPSQGGQTGQPSSSDSGSSGTSSPQTAPTGQGAPKTQTDPNGQGNQSPQGGKGGQGGQGNRGANIGQQLVDLLQSKTK